MVGRNLRITVCLSLGLLITALVLPTIAHQPSSANGISQAIRTNGLAGFRALVGHANVDAKDGTGFTPLVLAAAFGTREAVEVLLGAGANVNAESDGALTALHVAWHNDAVVRLLLARGAN